MEFSEISSKQQQNAAVIPSPHVSTTNTDGKVKIARERKPRRVIFKCKFCYKTFRNKAVFQAHLGLHKRQNDGIFRLFCCRSCGTNHRGLASFLEHQKIHEDAKNCVQQQLICSNEYEQRNELLADVEDSETALSSEVIITTTSDGNLHLSTAPSQVERNDCNNQPVSESVHIANESQSLLSQGVGLNSDVISNLPLPASTVSLMAALCSAATHPSTHVTNQQPTNSTSTNCKTVSSSDGVQIEIPSQVKAIYLNSSNANFNDISKQLESLHNKIDNILKHINIPFEGEATPLSTIQVQQPTLHKDLEHTDDDANASVMLESYPPSYSIVQAAKEQQQQEYYALMLSNRQAHQVFKNDPTHILTGASNELKTFQKGKGVDLWVPSHQYLSQLSTLSEQQEQDDDEEEIQNSIISTEIVDKVFVESRSRANFAKNLTFAVFSQEERQGKNCSGRVFGKAQHKGQLDAVKLAAVKEATFRKYPCHRPDLMDITWRKECVTAIDSGLRNENRTAAKVIVTSPHHHHHQIIIESAVTSPHDHNHHQLGEADGTEQVMTNM